MPRKKYTYCVCREQCERGLKSRDGCPLPDPACTPTVSAWERTAITCATSAHSLLRQMPSMKAGIAGSHPQRFVLECAGNEVVLWNDSGKLPTEGLPFGASVMCVISVSRFSNPHGFGVADRFRFATPFFAARQTRMSALFHCPFLLHLPPSLCPLPCPLSLLPSPLYPSSPSCRSASRAAALPGSICRIALNCAMEASRFPALANRMP